MGILRKKWRNETGVYLLDAYDYEELQARYARHESLGSVRSRSCWIFVTLHFFSRKKKSEPGELSTEKISRILF